MGLIRESAEIDFTVLSKIWTEEETKEFSELIKKQKEERNKQHVRLPRPTRAVRYSKSFS